MNSYRCNPDSPEAQEASRQNERAAFAAKMSATVFDVGTRWPAPGGWCEVARIDDDVAWIREPLNPGTLYRYDVGELPRLREVAAANLAYRERAAAREAELAAQEAERSDLDGWEASLSPMTLGRAQAVLMLSVLYRGRPMSRRDVVRLAVSEGARRACVRVDAPGCARRLFSTWIVGFLYSQPYANPNCRVSCHSALHSFPRILSEPFTVLDRRPRHPSSLKPWHGIC